MKMSKFDANCKPSDPRGPAKEVPKKHEGNDSKAHRIKLLKSVVKMGEQVTIIKSDDGSS